MLAQRLHGIIFLGVQLVTLSPPNNACTRQVGVCAFFKLFPGFEFFPLPNRVHTRPLAGNANRWAATCNKSFETNNRIETEPSMSEFTTVFLFTNMGVSQQYKLIFVIILYIFIMGGLFIYLLMNTNIPKQPSVLQGIVYIKDYRISTVNFLELLLLFIVLLPFFMGFLLQGGIGLQPITFGYPSYRELQDRYNLQQYLIAEGIVHVIHAQHVAGRDQSDIVKVGDTEFEINYFYQTYSYSQTINHGGALTEGTYARVFYIEMPPSSALKRLILRVDVKTH
jgi:hypothetical protein